MSDEAPSAPPEAPVAHGGVTAVTPPSDLHGGAGEASPGARGRPRGLVPVAPAPQRRPAGEPASSYRVRVEPTRTRLPRRPWRGVKLVLALFLLGAVAVFAAVQGFRAFSEVVDTDTEREVLGRYVEDGEGVRYEDVDAGFSAEFPVEAVRGVTTVPGDADERPAPEVSAEVDGVQFAVVWFDLAGETQDPAGTLSFIAAVTAEELGDDLSDRGMLPTAPVPAHEFAVTASDEIHLVRHVLDGTRIYQLRVSAQDAEEAAFTRFVDSFDLMGDGT